MARVLLNVPKTVARGEPIEIRVLISHPMESGQRRDDTGVLVPRDIIHSFTCSLGGELVFAATLFPAIAANPFLSFHAVTDAPGNLVLSWTDDHGATQTETVPIALE